MFKKKILLALITPVPRRPLRRPTISLTLHAYGGRTHFIHMVVAGIRSFLSSLIDLSHENEFFGDGKIVSRSKYALAYRVIRTALVSLTHFEDDKIPLRFYWRIVFHYTSEECSLLNC